jgi:hypothetical protein
VKTTPTASGNSGDAPGQNKPDPSTTASAPPGNSDNSNAGGNSNAGANSNAGGNASSNSGGNSGAGGSSTPPDDSNAGGNAGGGGGNPNSSGGSGGNNGDPAGEGDCDQNGEGPGGAYDATCDGTHQNPGPGNSDDSPGKPADGTVGQADNKNPRGQQPGGSDHNKGYECEPGSTNKGVGKGNPAHTGCAPTPPCTVNCNPGCTVNCTPMPPPDCDGDGVDDNVDPDISGCRSVPPKKDCDGDGVPDDVDGDLSGCQPIPLCPDGSVLPANGVCNPSILPDFVLGIRVNRKPVAPAVLPARVNKPAVAASLLPFTGGNLLPFVLVSVGLIGAGVPALRRRGDRT